MLYGTRWSVLVENNYKNGPATGIAEWTFFDLGGRVVRMFFATYVAELILKAKITGHLPLLVLNMSVVSSSC